jgi:hypothetical protein
VLKWDMAERGVRTVTSSVIFRTSLPSEDFHFTLYRVSQQSVSPELVGSVDVVCAHIPF